MWNSEKESLLKARKTALERTENMVEKLSEKNRILENNNTVIVTRDRIIIDVLKQIKMYSSCNTLGNDKAFLRKINELASTAID